MSNQEWNAYFRARLAEAEKELREFRQAVRDHGLRVWHRDINGERDMTASEDQVLQSQVDEYRAALKDD